MSTLYCIAECDQERYEGDPWPMEIGLIKIGVSNNPFARLESMRTANPRSLQIIELYLFHSRDEAFAVERMVHEYMKSHCVTREWFDGSGAPEHEAFSMCCHRVGYHPESREYVDYDKTGAFLLYEPLVFPERPL